MISRRTIKERCADGERQRDIGGAQTSTVGDREGLVFMLRATESSCFCEEMNLEEASAEVVGSLQEAERVMHNLRLTSPVEELQDMKLCEFLIIYVDLC